MLGKPRRHRLAPVGRQFAVDESVKFIVVHR
jgi:hypothetical protein